MAQHRRNPFFAGVDWMALAVAASPACIFLATFAATHLLPGMLAASAAVAEAAEKAEAAHPSSLREYLEIGSFAATIGLAVAAFVAGGLTYSQLRDAKTARIAAIYMDINKTYNSEALREARLEVLKLKRSPAAQAAADLATYIADTLEQWRLCDPASPEYGRFNRCIRILQFWEDVGVVTGWKFVDLDVVLDFHRSGLRASHTNFHVYINRARAADVAENAGQQPPYVTQLFENALTIFAAASESRPQ
jgi:hypothetical protein